MDTFYTTRMHLAGFPTNTSRISMESRITEESILSLLIVLGSSLSLVALVFAFITYSLFSDLRNLSGTTLMNLLSALFMTQLLYVIGVGGVLDPELCIALASALHYIRLCVFCWMLLITHNLYTQYRTGLNLYPITDKDIKKHFIKYTLFGWGLPLILLFSSILMQYYDKAGQLLDTQDLKGQNCWFLGRNAFVYGLLIPSIIMVFMTFYYIIRSTILSQYIVHMQPEKRLRDKMRQKGIIQLILFAKITSILSTCLILATLSKLFIKSETIWITFHIIQGLQGIFIAMLVTCNCQILKLYMRNLKSKAAAAWHIPTKYISGQIGINGRANSELNKSTSLQLLNWDPPPDLV